MEQSKKSLKCPRCGSKDVILEDTFDDGVQLYVCADCDHDWEVRGPRRGSQGGHRDYDSDFDDEFEESSEWEN